MRTKKPKPDIGKRQKVMQMLGDLQKSIRQHLQTLTQRHGWDLNAHTYSKAYDMASADHGHALRKIMTECGIDPDLRRLVEQEYAAFTDTGKSGRLQTLRFYDVLNKICT